jgi:hypothetical protein
MYDGWVAANSTDFKKIRNRLAGSFVGRAGSPKHDF